MKLEHELLDILNKKVFNYNDVVISSIIQEKTNKFYRKRSIRIIYLNSPITNSSVELYGISLTTKGLLITFRKRSYSLNSDESITLDISNPQCDISTLKEKFEKLTQYCMNHYWYDNLLRTDRHKITKEFTQTIREILTD